MCMLIISSLLFICRLKHKCLIVLFWELYVNTYLATPVDSGVTALGPTGALALPSASVVSPCKIFVY